MNEIFFSVLLLILFTFIFYSTGRSIQKKFNIAIEYFSLSIPIGFVTYFFVNQIFYIFFIFFGSSLSTFTILELAKISIFLIIVLINYKQWFEFNWFKHKRTYLNFLLFVSIFLMLMTFTQFSFFSAIQFNDFLGNQVSINSWTNHYLDNTREIIDPFTNIDNSNLAIANSRSYYYWNAASINMINVDLEAFNRWFTIPLVLLLIYSTTTFLSNVYFKNKNSYLATIPITIFLFIFSYSFNYSGSLFLLFFFLILWSLYATSYYSSSSKNSLVFSSFALIALSSFSDKSILISIIWLINITFLQIKNSKSFTRFSGSAILAASFQIIIISYSFIADFYFWLLLLGIYIALVFLIFYLIKNRDSTASTTISSNYIQIFKVLVITTLVIGVILISADFESYIQEVLPSVYSSGYESFEAAPAFIVLRNIFNNIVLILVFSFGMYFYLKKKKLTLNYSLLLFGFMIISLFYNPISIMLLYNLGIKDFQFLNYFIIFIFIWTTFVFISKIEFKEIFSERKNLIATNSIVAILSISLLIFSNVSYSLNYVTGSIFSSKEVTEYVNNNFTGNYYVVGDIHSVYKTNPEVEINQDIYLDFISKDDNFILSENLNFISINYVDDALVSYMNYYKIDSLYFLKSSQLVYESVPIYWNNCDISNDDFYVFYMNIDLTQETCSI